MTINMKRNSGLGSLSVLYLRVVEIPAVKTPGGAGDELCAAAVRVITPVVLRSWATPSIKRVPAMGQRIGIGRKKMKIDLAPKGSGLRGQPECSKEFPAQPSAGSHS
jgi:hypothetical protein